MSSKFTAWGSFGTKVERKKSGRVDGWWRKGGLKNEFVRQ